MVECVILSWPWIINLKVFIVVHGIFSVVRGVKVFSDESYIRRNLKTAINICAYEQSGK